MLRDISVGYLYFLNKSFVSAVTVENNFLDLLSKYIKVVTINTTPEQEYAKKLNKLSIDYLIVDIYCFDYGPFLWREKGKFNVPFIIILHTIYDWVERLIYIIPLIRKEDIIVTPSEYTKESFLKITGKFKVYVIPHCLDIKGIQNNILLNHYNSEKKVITYIGRLEKKKGIEVLLKCLPRIIREIKEVHLNIISPLSGGLMSDKKSPYYFKLKKLIKRLKLNNYVEFKGLQIGLDKYRVLSQANIFINPSLYTDEAFGMVNIEALACGLPVICTSCNAFKEIIRVGKNGFFVDVDYDGNGKFKINTDQLVYLIVRVLKDKTLNNRLRMQAKKDALKYDYRKVMPKLVGLLKRKRYTEIEDRWSLIKNKRIIEFKDLYQREMLFFIISSGWANKTYLDLFKRIIKSAPIVNKPKKINYISSNKTIRLYKKIYRELFKYLCMDVKFKS